MTTRDHIALALLQRDLLFWNGDYDPRMVRDAVAQATVAVGGMHAASREGKPGVWVPDPNAPPGKRASTISDCMIGQGQPISPSLDHDGE